MRNHIEDWTAYQCDHRPMIVNGNSARRRDCRPAHWKADADQEHPGENAKIRRLLEFAEVGALVDCIANPLNIRKPQTKLVEPLIHE